MDPTMLTKVLATGAAMALPVKAGVDAIKRASPDLPPWALLGLAFLIGQALVWLVALYSGAPLDMQGIAGITLAGLGATGAAIASTEIHKAARTDAPPTDGAGGSPTLPPVIDGSQLTAEQIVNEMERQRQARVMARLHDVSQTADDAGPLLTRPALARSSGGVTPSSGPAVSPTPPAPFQEAH